MRMLMSAAALTALMMGTAAASPYTLTGSVQYSSETANISDSIDPPTLSSVDAYVSPVNMTITDQGANPAPTAMQLVYCTDIFDDYTPGGTYTRQSGLPNFSSSQTEEVAALLANAPSGTAAADAVIQAVIWKVLFPNVTIQWNTSDISTSDITTDLANVGIGGTAIWAVPSSDFLVSFTSTGGNQNFVYLDPAPVPEPSSMAILGAGLLGLVVLGRKRLVRT